MTVFSHVRRPKSHRLTLSKLAVPSAFLTGILGLLLVAGCGSESPTTTAALPSTETTVASTESSADSTATSGVETTDTIPEADQLLTSLELTNDDNGGSFRIMQGGTIEVALKTDPTTGYSWRMELLDPEASLLEQLEEPNFEFDDPQAGPAGVMRFTFKAVDRGEMIVTYVYVSKDPTEPPADTFEINLTVK